MISVIIPAGGIGKRFGSTLPKQFVEVNGKEIITYSIDLFESIEEIKSIIVAIHPEYIRKFKKMAKEKNWNKVEIVRGGRERMDSVWNALKKVRTKYVLVHDAVRPLVDKNLTKRVIKGMLKYGACIPVIEIPETVKEVKKNSIVKTVPREKLKLSQTPQGFETSILREGYRRAIKNRILITDEAMALELIGRSVYVVKGSKKNIKITYKDDIRLMKCLLKRKRWQ